MLKLQPFQVCGFSNVCIYSRDCKGLDSSRKSFFNCSFADEIRQEEKKEIVCEEGVCRIQTL